MYTTTTLGLAVKTVMERPRSLKFRRYALMQGNIAIEPRCKMSEEMAANANNALSCSERSEPEGGSDYRWVLVEGEK